MLAEIVIDPAPAPTLTIPAPEILRRLENVPDELPVVFPRAVRETEDVWTEAEIVIVELAWPIPMPAPADTDNAPLEALRSETLFSALDEALKVRLNDPAPDALASEILSPPKRATLSAAPVTEVPPPLKDCVPPAAAAGAEIVIVPPEAPTDTTPAPEMLRLFPTVRVVDAAPRVFPAIVAVMVE